MESEAVNIWRRLWWASASLLPIPFFTQSTLNPLTSHLPFLFLLYLFIWKLLECFNYFPFILYFPVFFSILFSPHFHHCSHALFVHWLLYRPYHASIPLFLLSFISCSDIIHVLTNLGLNNKLTWSSRSTNLPVFQLSLHFLLVITWIRCLHSVRIWVSEAQSESDGLHLSQLDFGKSKKKGELAGLSPGKRESNRETPLFLLYVWGVTEKFRGIFSTYSILVNVKLNESTQI